MELIRINSNKLKIMLTSLDMKNYALDAKSISCETEETRRAFRNILHDAGVGSGFEEGQEKIYVQYYPSREGGCEMFVTRLGDHTTDDACTPGQLTSKEKESAAQALVYRFERLSSLLQACRHLLHAEKKAGERRFYSCAHRDGDERFYLTITLPAHKGEQAKILWPIVERLLGEFGTRCPTEEIEAYIAERATPLCSSRAVQTLGELC